LHQGKVLRSEAVVLVLTGHTLKDSDYTIDFHRERLLNAEETRGWETELAATRRGTLSVEATADAVLHALETTIEA
jgi:threonine synthase